MKVWKEWSVIDTRLDFIRAQLPRGSILKIYQTPTFFSASHICTERYHYWKKWCEMHVKYMWNFHLVFHIQFHTSVKNNVQSLCENHVKWCPPFHIIKCCEKDMWNCEMCVKLCEMCAAKSRMIDHVNLTCEIYKNIHRKLWKKVCETFNIFKNQENVT